MRTLITLLISLTSLQAFAQAPIVFWNYDINTSAQRSSNPNAFTNFKGKIIFSAYTDDLGYELWMTDGSGVQLIKDLSTHSSGPLGFTEYGGRLYFTANDPNNYGIELFVTDGTTSGTGLFADINPGSGYGLLNGAPMTVYNGKLYFGATNGSIGGAGLWISDGTTAGTQLLKNINTVSSAMSILNFITFNGKLYFAASDGTNGIELWVTDGTAAGTVMVKDINPGAGNSQPSNFLIVGTDMYFKATTTATGSELWKTDGTTAGTVMVKDINPGTGTGYGGALINYNGKLYFGGNDGVAGTELWQTDGTATGTFMFKELSPGTNGGEPTYFTVYNGKLYFSGKDNNYDRELWSTDGTVAGTTRIIDLLPGTNGSTPEDFIVYKNHLYFSAQQTPGDRQIFRTDGTATGTQKFTPFTANHANPLLTTAGFFLNPTDSALYFAAYYTDPAAVELWSLKDTTGSGSGTGIGFVNVLDAFSLYPNPNNGTFTLQLENVDYKNASVQVYDVVGRECYKAQLTNTQSQIAINQPSGMYLVKLNIDGVVHTKKIKIE